MSGNVSFKEFLHQYYELRKWLEQLKSFKQTTRFNNSMSSCEKYTNQIFYEEIIKRSPRRQLLNEYACHLIKYHPHLRTDVIDKLQYLNKLWKNIEFAYIAKFSISKNIIKGNF